MSASVILPVNQLGNRLAEGQDMKRAELPAERTLRTSLVIAIDGPAASGKGTLARRVAAYYGLDYLDTGALYRAVALKMMREGIADDDVEAIPSIVSSLNEEDLNDPDLRSEGVGKKASILSAQETVREALLAFQRNFAVGGRGAVLDGRDIGTVVCPDAEIKLFVTATLDSRAERRYKELQGKGNHVIYEEVLADLRQRDRRDSERSISPLKAADDAFHLDTTSLDADAVFDQVVALVQDRFPVAV